MEKIIIIKRLENQKISIVNILKSLYMDGTEIDSLEKINFFIKKYREKGLIEIKVSEEAAEIFNGYFSEEEEFNYIIK